MQALVDYLVEKREVTIQTLASYSRQYLQQRWEAVLQADEEDLRRVFAKAGEVAYGMYGRSLLQPLLTQFSEAEFVYEGANFSTSIEHWGPPEERERCMWCVLKTNRQPPQALGTLVFRIFHDHTRFRLPSPPSLLTLAETAPAAIVEALSHTFVRRDVHAYEGTFRLATGEEAEERAGSWEYSVEIGLGDSLDAHRLELSQAMLDQALARWGRYGWDLVSTVSHQGRLLAFFKRARP
ncbi:MAG TPA: DUF6022 family protein [Ktedonobacteraceae bacterium]|jgi:hypothetical protein